MGREILLLTAYFEHSVGFRSDINANLMQDVCFLTRDGRLPLILGADFHFPPSLWQDPSTRGGSLWIQKLGASVVAPVSSTHTCRTGRGRKPDIIDYFLVSTLIRPLILKCEVVKSVPWCPHFGVRLVLNIDFEVVRACMHSTQDRSRTQLRKSRRTGRRQCGMLPICKCGWFSGRGRRLGPRFGDLE